MRGISKRQVQYSLKELRTQGLIRKVGYGTWEVLAGRVPAIKKKVQKIHRVARTHTPPEGAKPDSVRAHGLVVTVGIPRDLRNWDKRETILQNARIEFDPIPQGQRILLGKEKMKVWLTNRSIVYYLPWSWYADTAKAATWGIMQDVLELIKTTTRKVGINPEELKTNGRYKIKFSRQHYSLIKNALAKAYNKTGEKLFVYDWRGLWLLIDNSYNQNELETVHPVTAPEDNGKVQDFWNDVKSGRFQETLDNILHLQQGGMSTLNALANTQNIQAALIKQLTDLMQELARKRDSDKGGNHETEM